MKRKDWKRVKTSKHVDHYLHYLVKCEFKLNPFCIIVCGSRPINVEENCNILQSDYLKLHGMPLTKLIVKDNTETQTKIIDFAVCSVITVCLD